MKEAVIGVDLGGTNIKAGAVTLQGEVLVRHRVSTLAEEGPDAVIGRICNAVHHCAVQLERQDATAVGVGVGSPGPIDLREGVVIEAPNLPGWDEVPLRDKVAEGAGLHCVLENDANAAALAEQWVGAGRGADSLVMFTLGTGIGGGIVLDGKVWHGTKGYGGEIGHMSINPDGPLCGCGNRGCIEAYASATAMVRRMQEAIDVGVETTLSGMSGEFTARDICEAALSGDAAARQNFIETGTYLGVAVTNIVHILNPAVVVLSGGVIAAGELLMNPIQQEARGRLMGAFLDGLRICFAELGEDAGSIGAARSFMTWQSSSPRG